jgi:hypothetical protein
MSEDGTIRGETTLTWGDHARLSMKPLAKGMTIFIVLAIVVFMVIRATALSDREWLLLLHDPLAALGAFARDIWPVLLTCVLAMLILMAGLYARAFHGFPHPNRRLSYEATRHGITTRDAADFALAVPWSNVTRAQKREHTILMQLATGGWRIIFLRAFAPEDREQILRWAQRKPDMPGSRSAT